MLLFLNKIKKIYSPCLVSVVHLAYFVVSGVFQVFVTAFYRQTPEPPSLALKQRNKPNGQQKPGKVSIFSLFYSKSNILFHRAILSFVILSSIQCLAERYANYQRPNV